MTETVEDNRDDDEPVCGEGGDSGKYKPKEEPKTLKNRRNKLIVNQWTCVVLLKIAQELIGNENNDCTVMRR